MYKISRASFLVLFVILSCFKGLKISAGNPAETPEGKKALKYSVELEQDPFVKGGKEKRAFILGYLMQSPDISITLCTNLISPILNDKANPQQTLLSTQLFFSICRFVLENPDKKDDKAAYHLGGVEGLLRVYEIILKKEPGARSTFLDDLLERRNKGELKTWVEQQLSTCK